MSLRSAAAVLVVLAVTTVFAQESTPASAPAPGPAAVPQASPQPVPMRRWGRGTMAGKTSEPLNAPSLQQRVQDMQATVDAMHVALKKMQRKAAATSKDPMAKANLQMWDLMVGHLDKQLQQLKQAEASRAEMEARRAAMYKQAEVNSQGVARPAQQPTPPVGQAAVPAAPASAAPAAPPNSSASPN